MTSSDDFHLISWQNGLGLGGSESLRAGFSGGWLGHSRLTLHSLAVIVAVLIPVALRRAFAADIADAAAVDEDPDAASTSAPLLHPRASLSLDSDMPHHVRGTRRELLDGTTRSSTDGSARLKRYEDEDEEASVGSSGARPSSGSGSADKASRVLGVRVT